MRKPFAAVGLFAALGWTCLAAPVPSIGLDAAFFEIPGPGGGFDLSGRTLMLVPTPYGWDACHQPATAFPWGYSGNLFDFPATDGQDIATVAIALGWEMPFAGGLYDTVHVTSAGTILFGGSAVSGYDASAPRLSVWGEPLGHTWIPDCPDGEAKCAAGFNLGGNTRYQLGRSALGLTFNDVFVGAQSGDENWDGSRVSFQVIIHIDGTIEMAWLNLPHPPPVVGVLPAGDASLTGAQANFDAYPDRCRPIHSDGYDNRISLSGLLRGIQIYNARGYRCHPGTEDGYAPGAGDGEQACEPHSSDYRPQDWRIDFSELLRLIQLFNSVGYRFCPSEEDGYCPVPFR